MLEDFFDWFMEYGCLPIIGLFAIAFACGIVYGCTQDQKSYEHFMEQCMKDHKEYECVAMWRAGEKHDGTAVVPIPIVIPVSR